MIVDVLYLSHTPLDKNFRVLIFDKALSLFGLVAMPGDAPTRHGPGLEMDLGHAQ